MFKRALVILNRKGRGLETDAHIAGLQASSAAGITEQHASQPPQIRELIAWWQTHIVLDDAPLMRAGTSAPAQHLPSALFHPPEGDGAGRVGSSDDEMIATLPGGMLRGIDVGMVNGHYFFHGISIAPERASSSFHVEIICDGRSRHWHSTGIAIGIGRYIEDAPLPELDGLDQHQLFLSSRAPLRWSDRFKPAPPTGRCGEVGFTQARHIQIITEEALTIVADGEAVTRTPATFTLLPQAIAALAPVNFME